MEPLPTLSALGLRYRPHIADICAGLAEIAARHRPISAILYLVWVRLRRTLMRLDSLATRWHSGRLRPPAKRPRAPRTPKPIHPGDAWIPTRTPQGHAWLVRLHQPLAQFAPRAELLLNDPDIIALCAAAPQARRLLRPLARMFALPLPPHLATPPRPRPPRPPKAPKPAPPPFAEHSPLQWPFVPLHLRLRVPGLPRRRKPDKQAALF